MEFRACDEIKSIEGDFCVTCISHSNPKTAVAIDMGGETYFCTTANVSKFAVDDVKNKDLGFFSSGVFCKEITIDAPDAHVIVVYEDLDDDNQV